MSLQNEYKDQPDRGDIQNVDHRLLHGDALNDLEGAFARFLAHFAYKMFDGKLPSRADVKPHELKPYLLKMVILELVKGDEEPFSDVVTRLIGSDVEHFYGNMTGRSVNEHPNKNAVARTLDAIRKVVELRAPVLADTVGRLADGNDLSVKSLYIPLAEDGEVIDRVVIYVEIKKSPPK